MADIDFQSEIQLEEKIGSGAFGSVFRGVSARRTAFHCRKPLLAALHGVSRAAIFHVVLAGTAPSPCRSP